MLRFKVESNTGKFYFAPNILGCFFDLISLFKTLNVALQVSGLSRFATGCPFSIQSHVNYNRI